MVRSNCPRGVQRWLVGSALHFWVLFLAMASRSVSAWQRAATEVEQLSLPASGKVPLANRLFLACGCFSILGRRCRETLPLFPLRFACRRDAAGRVVGIGCLAAALGIDWLVECAVGRAC